MNAVMSAENMGSSLASSSFSREALLCAGFFCLLVRCGEKKNFLPTNTSTNSYI